MSAKALGTCPLLAQMSAAVVTLSPVPGSAGSWCWGPQLGQKPTAAKLLAFCCGFPLEI